MVFGMVLLLLLLVLGLVVLVLVGVVLWGFGEERTEGVVRVVECRTGGQVDWVGGKGVVGVKNGGGFGVGLCVNAEDDWVEGWFCWWFRLGVWAWR